MYTFLLLRLKHSLPRWLLKRYNRTSRETHLTDCPAEHNYKDIPGKESVRFEERYGFVSLYI